LQDLSPGAGKERHHIIPKSLGGNNDHENLVVLWYREHYIAHRLLVKMIHKTETNSLLVF